MFVKYRLLGSGLVALLLAVLWTLPSVAKSEKAVNDIIKSLAPIKGQRVSPGYGQRKRERIDDDYVEVIYDYAVDLEVFFRYDSAQLTRQARRQLDALGWALTSENLEPYRYLIAGHTDAKGSRQYNRKLSWRRALAVKRYLVRNYDIPRWRLRAVGWGESRLKNPRRPNSAINRRVEVVMIAPPYDALGQRDRSRDDPQDEDLSRYDGSGDDGVAGAVVDEDRETDNGRLPPCRPGDLMNLDDYHRKPGVECEAPLGWKKSRPRIDAEGKVHIDW
jgi:outer membrane protein OmpA-like peptidoglycan-associated protein